ncbi:hypothetical protein ABBQ32_007220 [Trebouxia sp. C0010 RCD-2024]
MVVAGADTPAEFALGSQTVQAQQDRAESQGKHPAEVPGTLSRGDASAEAGVAGPALQLNNFDVDAGIWQGSVLYLTKQSTQPVLQLQTVDGRVDKVQPFLLTELYGWACWRFNLEVKVQQQEQQVFYTINVDPFGHRYSFFVAGLAQTWHWGFHSCNGLSADGDHKKWGGPYEFVLWRDVMEQHGKQALHAMVGGGDQIYNDEVFSGPQMQEWLKSGRKGLGSVEWSDAMAEEAAHFYFTHYRQHWCSMHLSDALACIPQVMMWDDHDIFDGWGSYPRALLACSVFQGLFRTARQMYLLFQQQTTLERAASDNGMWGPFSEESPACLKAFSLLRMLGPTTCLVAPDSRAERTKKQIISEATYNQMFQLLHELPHSCRHVVVLLTVPIVFPALPGQEKVWRLLDNAKVGHIMSKTGMGQKIVDNFGEAKLLDDIIDHWDAGQHHGERHNLIARLQNLAKTKNVRVSFVGGDVHVAGVGRLYTQPKIHRLRYDHRFMPQIVSSAIVNAPPPPTFMKLLHNTNRSNLVLKPQTREKMVRVFAGRPTGDKLLAQRNWCEVREVPATTEQIAQLLENSSIEITADTPGCLIYSLRVEESGEGRRAPAGDLPVISQYDTGRLALNLQNNPDKFTS